MLYTQCTRYCIKGLTDALSLSLKRLRANIHVNLQVSSLHINFAFVRLQMLIIISILRERDCNRDIFVWDLVIYYIIMDSILALLSFMFI